MRQIISILALVVLLGSCGPSYHTYREDVYYDPPYWAADYHVGIHYYYFPNYGMYYSIPAHQWVYYNGMYWVYSYDPPYWCSGANFTTVYYVPLNYTGSYPYHHHSQHAHSYPPRNTNIYYGPRKSLPTQLQADIPPRNQRKKVIKEPAREQQRAPKIDRKQDYYKPRQRSIPDQRAKPKPRMDRAPKKVAPVPRQMPPARHDQVRPQKARPEINRMERMKRPSRPAPNMERRQRKPLQ